MGVSFVPMSKTTKTILLSLGTFLYCLSCLYFLLFASFNSIDCVKFLFWNTSFRRNCFGIYESSIPNFLIVLFVGLLSCIMITIVIRKVKYILPIWCFVVFVILIFFTMGYVSSYSFHYIILSVMMFFEFIYSIILFIFYRKEKVS